MEMMEFHVVIPQPCPKSFAIIACLTNLHYLDWNARRILFVVSTKYGRSYETIKSSLGDLDGAAPFIDWEGHKTEAFSSPFSFVRHFAICAISFHDWNNDSLTLMQKFRGGTFWELVGPDLIPREGDSVHWKEEKIETIDGVLEIGHMSFDNEAVSEQCKPTSLLLLILG